MAGRFSHVRRELRGGERRCYCGLNHRPHTPCRQGRHDILLLHLVREVAENLDLTPSGGVSSVKKKKTPNAQNLNRQATFSKLALILYIQVHRPPRQQWTLRVDPPPLVRVQACPPGGQDPEAGALHHCFLVGV